MELRHKNVLIIFTIGIPNGSLIDPERGGLNSLLDTTGIYTKNLGSKAPPEIVNIPWLKAVSGRPQELPALAYLNYIDIFFCGDDWVEEWKLKGKENIKLLGLGIGKVNIVFAGKQNSSNKLPIRTATEYPFIAREFISNRYNIPKLDIPIIKLGEDIPSGKRAIIIESIGVTEAKPFYYNRDGCLADAIVEATQKGVTLGNYGLNVFEEIMTSECSLYISPWLRDNKLKMSKITELKIMFERVVNSQSLKTSKSGGK